MKFDKNWLYKRRPTLSKLVTHSRFKPQTLTGIRHMKTGQEILDREEILPGSDFPHQIIQHFFY
jgi:hypothetical protein